MNGTNNAVQLTNNSYFGASAFPTSTNIDTNATFDAASAFATADFGENVNVRLLMVWALATDGHYQPIFRIDAVTGGEGPDHGVHGVNFIKSSLVTGDSGIGYYSQTGDFSTGTPNNECWSYQYTWNAGTSTWTRGAARSNCLILSQDDIILRSAIHGSVMTNKPNGISLSGGSISGSQCANPGCVSYTLPVNPTWAVRCAGAPIVDVTIASAVQNLTSGAALAQQCYRNVTVPSNRRVNFATVNHPYYIQNLILQNNSNSRMSFSTSGPGNKYMIYADNFNGGSINGNLMISTNLAPHQLEIYLTQGGTTFTLNGTATINAVFVGTNTTTIRHNGNFPFYGAYRANTVQVLGNATLGYDEALGGSPVLTDINFTLFKASQRYR